MRRSAPGRRYQILISTAGPYGHRLLGIDIECSHRFEREISRGCEGTKPGWVRINFNYFIDEETFEFILAAVHLVARDGWRLLPQYTFDPASGLWRHQLGPADPPLGLHDVTFTGKGSPTHNTATPPRRPQCRSIWLGPRRYCGANRQRRHPPASTSARTSNTCGGSRCLMRCRPDPMGQVGCAVETVADALVDPGGPPPAQPGGGVTQEVTPGSRPVTSGDLWGRTRILP